MPVLEEANKPGMPRGNGEGFVGATSDRKNPDALVARILGVR